MIWIERKHAKYFLTKIIKKASLQVDRLAAWLASWFVGAGSTSLVVGTSAEAKTIRLGIHTSNQARSDF